MELHARNFVYTHVHIFDGSVTRKNLENCSRAPCRERDREPATCGELQHEYLKTSKYSFHVSPMLWAGTSTTIDTATIDTESVSTRNPCIRSVWGAFRVLGAIKR